MRDWLGVLWRKKGQLLGGLAVLAIVFSTIWIYSGSRVQMPDEQYTASTTSQNKEVEGQSIEYRASEDSSPQETNQELVKPQSQLEQDPHSESVQTESEKEKDEATSKAKSSDKVVEEDSAVNGKEQVSSGVEKNNAAEKSNTKSQPSSSSSTDLSKKPKDIQQDGKGSDVSSPKSVNKDAVRKEKLDNEKQGAGTSKTTKEKKTTTQTDATPPPSKTVQITIVGSSEIGTILNTEEIEIGDSETVMDILKKATRAKKIQMDFSGAGAAAYVKGIDNLYEFDKGSGSGWMYSINNKFPNKSAGAWEVKPGDHIQWLYTEDLGKDLGAGTDDGLWDGKS
ncbi:hypothetical protein BBG47_06340 [Paenibacillus sp. KS1]|uniref:DUF4430 domain-containing protein n=1 Tax=Paenibacillus sp. KS1 TaxID=1849249 RepID=UPI0008065C1B|nr:DUF4430 domain-containing protein [Paenibacillus sp. KS1]OBY80478.1 hypothetical protein BBG47_06340 [Paenibacillus sp. KS1]